MQLKKKTHTKWKILSIKKKERLFLFPTKNSLVETCEKKKESVDSGGGGGHRTARYESKYFSSFFLSFSYTVLFGLNKLKKEAEASKQQQQQQKRNKGSSREEREIRPVPNYFTD